MKITELACATVLVVGFLAHTPRARATDGDAINQEALLKTQQLLVSPEQRKKAGADSAQATTAMKDMESLAGSPENAEEMYALTAEVLATLVKDSKGDTVQMMQLMEDLRAHPEKFEKLLTPAQKARLSALSKRLPAATPAKP